MISASQTLREGTFGSLSDGGWTEVARIWHENHLICRALYEVLRTCDQRLAVRRVPNDGVDTETTGNATVPPS
jgi:hypothetical protein